MAKGASTRHFYAAHAPYGLRTAYGKCHVPVIHVFASKAERDAWVDADRWEGDFHREPMGSREAKRWIRRKGGTVEAHAGGAWYHTEIYREEA